MQNDVERVYVYDPFCPIHGSRRRMKRRRMRIRDLDYHLASIESVDNTEPSGVILLRKAIYISISNFNKTKVSIE